MTEEIQLWSEDKVAALHIVKDALKSSFRDAVGETGSGSLTVPYSQEYAQLFARDLVVVHVIDGVQRFAWVIERDENVVVGDEPALMATGRGLLSWLEWATIYPSGGLRRTSGDDRIFGFGSAEYFVDGNGGDSLGVAWVPPTTVARAAPSGWGDVSTYGIWPTASNAEPGTVAYFRRGFSTSAGQKIRIDATGDDAITVWLDGEQIIDQDGTDRIDPGANKLTTVRRTLAAGSHWIYLRGRQIDPLEMADLGVPAGGQGPSWVAIRIASIADDTENGTLIIRTGDTWGATLETPGWTPGLCLSVVLNEAVQRGVDRVYWQGYSYSNAVDSNGQAWPHLVNRSWPVGTDFLKLISDLADMGVEVWATPDKTLHAAMHRGTDKSDEVRLYPAKQLTSYGIVRNHKVRTVALAKSESGWSEVTDPAESVYGRAETRIDLSVVNSLTQATEVAGTALAPLAQPTRETNGDQTRFVAMPGSMPYDDFSPGDGVSVPDGNGGWTPARLMALTRNDGEWAAEFDLAQAGARRASLPLEQRILNVAASGGAASAGGRIQSATK